MKEKKVVLSKAEKIIKATQITDCLTDNNIFKAKLLCGALYRGRNKGKSVFRIILQNILNGNFNNKYNNEGHVVGYKAGWGEFRNSVGIITSVVLERFTEVISFLTKRDMLPIGKILTVSQVSDIMLYVRPEYFKFLFESGMIVLSQKSLKFQSQNSSNGPIVVSSRFTHGLGTVVLQKVCAAYNLDTDIVSRLPILLGIIIKNFTTNIRYILEHSSDSTNYIFSSASERLMDIDIRIQRKDFISSLETVNRSKEFNVAPIDKQDLYSFGEIYRTTLLPHIVYISNKLQNNVFQDPKAIYDKYNFNLTESTLSRKEKEDK